MISEVHVKRSVYALSVLLVIKTLLCFVLSTCLVEVPRDHLPPQLKEDCNPLWYGWVSLLLNALGLAFSSLILHAMIVESMKFLFLGIVSLSTSTSCSALVHLSLWIMAVKAHTMIILNLCGGLLSAAVCIMSALHYYNLKYISPETNMHRDA